MGLIMSLIQDWFVDYYLSFQKGGIVCCWLVWRRMSVLHTKSAMSC